MSLCIQQLKLFSMPVTLSLSTSYSILYFCPNNSLLLLLSHFSRVRLCVTPQTSARQALLPLGFSRQEHWSGLPFPSPMHEREKVKVKSLSRVRLQRPHGLQPTRLLRPWDFPGKSTGVGCHCLLRPPTLLFLKCAALLVYHYHNSRFSHLQRYSLLFHGTMWFIVMLFAKWTHLHFNSSLKSFTSKGTVVNPYKLSQISPSFSI